MTDDDRATCKRHRDRETGLRCTRCGTPTCWECLTPAAVGSHCPDCLREGKKDAPRHVEMPWGRQAASATLVTATVVFACVVVFVMQQTDLGVRIVGNFSDVGFLVHEGEWYRLVTSMFLHGGLLHVMFNMAMLWMVGQDLERSEGRVRFAIAYFAAGIIGGLASYFFVFGFTPSYGASGGVFGLIGIALVRTRQRNLDIRPLVMYLGINLLLPFVIPNINIAAHLGGLAAGVLYAALTPEHARGARHWGGTVAVCVVALAGVAATTAIPPPL